MHSSHWKAFPGSYDSQIGINLGDRKSPYGRRTLAAVRMDGWR
jgi:hypothetical protein